jgi:Cu+-exporting ATPase
VDKSRQQETSPLDRAGFYVALFFTVPLVYISMGHMVGLPLPGFLMPGMHPFNFVMAQLILTLPVIIAGYKFYTIGFRNLFKLTPNMDSLVAIGTGRLYIWCLRAG